MRGNSIARVQWETLKCVPAAKQAAKLRLEKSFGGEKRDRGAQLNNNNNNKKKNPTKPTKSKPCELTSSLPAETTWPAAFLMRLLLIKGLENNCTRCGFGLAATMPVAPSQIKVMFSIPSLPLLTFNFLYGRC